MDNLNFEEALKELEVIVKSLEDGSGSLDDAIKAYEKGVKLKSFCEEKLSLAKLKIEQINGVNEGNLSTEEFLS